MVCWLGQYVIQYATDDYERLPQFAQFSLLEGLDGLSRASGPSEFLEILSLSRLFTWLPPGWATAGMGLAILGDWGRALAFLAFSTAFVVVLLWVHARVTRRLMEGAALGIGAQRVRGRRRGWLRLPGPAAFWALFRKDWMYLWRSPLPRRLIFSALIAIAAMLVPIRNAGREDLSPRAREALPLATGAFAVTVVGMIVNMGITANYFGAVDREGFATLALCAHDRRHVILSANLIVTLFAGALWLVLLSGIALLTRYWVVLPLGLYLALCMQLGSAPAYNLASIVGPYRTQLKFRGRQRGNLWGMLAWLISAPPVLAMVVLPFIFWRPGLVLTLPLGAVYSVGLYVLTLGPLARLLERREHTLLEAVTTQE
jgi:hypothetical protein